MNNNWEKQFDRKWSDYLPEGFMFQNGLYSDEQIKTFISTEIIEKILENIPKAIFEVGTNNVGYHFNTDHLKQQLRDKWL